jgi:peroxin-1
VQLVPGTELVVAPKTRFKSPPKPNPQIEQTKLKALLRVQAGDNKHVYQFNYRGLELGVSLTSCVFIHPETALNIGFGNLEFGVVSPKVVPKEGSKNGKGEVSVTKKVLNSTLNSRERNRHIVLRVIYSNSVAKGHLMLPRPVRHYIRADVHECEFEVLLPRLILFVLLSLFLILSP